MWRITLCKPMKPLLGSGVLKSMFLYNHGWSTACDWQKGLLWDMAIIWSHFYRELISGCITDYKGSDTTWELRMGYLSGGDCQQVPIEQDFTWPQCGLVKSFDKRPYISPWPRQIIALTSVSIYQVVAAWKYALMNVGPWWWKASPKASRSVPSLWSRHATTII